MPSVPLLCLTGAVFVYLLVVSIFAGVGKRSDEKHRRLENAAPEKGADKKKQRKSLKMVASDMRERQLRRSRNSKSGTSEQTNKKKSATQKQLELLDIPMTSVTFLLIRMVCGFVVACVAWGVAMVLPLDTRVPLFAALVGLLLGFAIPGIIVSRRAKSRQAQLRRDLPDIMDLLMISVEAGLGFDAAIMRVYNSNRSPLTEELASAIRDVQHGVSRKEAYEGIAKKCDVKELTSFTNALLQAEQLGISVRSVLATQAESLREGRRRAAEEKALKAPVTMMIPMVLFIFPTILIILLGPAAKNLMEVF